MPNPATLSLPREILLTPGLKISGDVHYQCSPDELVSAVLARGEGQVNDQGALVIRTGKFTGRSPKDKYIVRERSTQNHIHWNEFNQPIDPEYFDRTYRRMLAYLSEVGDLWVRDAQTCADPAYRLNVRLITEKPADSLFVYNMFLRPEEEELENFLPDWKVFVASNLQLDPDECGTRQPNAAMISFRDRTVLIAGTGYTGEIKKGMFTILNYLLPQHHEVLSMHCSANKSTDGSTALFFGLSGTGKTTLSADPERMLIGDDEHGWTAEGVFNFEGGCYAKCISLSEEKEPDIFRAIRPGALLENVSFFEGTNQVNYDDGSITENTRVSYPLHFISNAADPAIGDHPEHIFFLTCDAYGVLPPISRLSPEQAMYQFISGYTAKVAGTETGVTEPKATFSACFGAPFLPLHPGRYADMLGKKLRDSQAKVWLVNTGWTGGPYGTGQRIRLSHTRALISAVLDGKLNHDNFEIFPIFNVEIPRDCPGVPSTILNPALTWSDRDAYTKQAIALAQMFQRNFEKYAAGVSKEIKAAAPII